MRPFGVALVGTGIMGRRMLAMIGKHARFQAVTLWDPRVDVLREVLSSVVGARAANDLDDAVGDPVVDLVYIASPPSMHLRGVEAALASRHACLCEKPLAATIGEARAIVDRVAGAGLPFAVHFPFASLPASRALIDRVRGRLADAESEIERVAITLRFARWPRPWQAAAADWLSGSAEGGFTREVLSHFVFLALRLFGPATVEDLRLTRAPGHAETALRARLVHAKIEIAIDAAVSGDVADHNRFEIVWRDGGSIALVDWARLEENGQPASFDPVPDTLDRVARMLDGHADHDLATAAEGLAVVRCIERMLDV